MRPTWTSSPFARSLLLLSMLFACSPARARAADSGSLQIEWRAPAQCPDRADVEQRVLARLQDPTARHSRVHASGQIFATDAGYRLTLETDSGQRTLNAAECDDLADAAALMLALLIDPQAGARPPPLKPAPNERSVWALFRPELAADGGTLPRVALGPALSVGVRLYATSLELSGTYLPSQNVFAAQRTAAVAELHLLSAALGACQALTRSAELSPCLRFEYGQLAGRGKNLMTPLKADGGWALALVGVRASAELVPHVRLMLELELGLPLLGATLTVNPVGSVHQTSDVVGRLRAGVELRL